METKLTFSPGQNIRGPIIRDNNFIISIICTQNHCSPSSLSSYSTLCLAKQSDLKCTSEKKSFQLQIDVLFFKAQTDKIWSRILWSVEEKMLI